MTELQPLTLPLTGRQVIEASAGTGKTWTLAALYLRLVLGHGRQTAEGQSHPGLLPPQILVMTFTEAATAELRERIRQRLHDAAMLFDSSAQQRALPEGFEADTFLTELRDSFDETLWPRCALQLSAAADWMDDAAIYTIHGWSRRMLSQHALDSRHLFEQTRLDNAQALQRQLVQDYWRTWFYPQAAGVLQHVQPSIGRSPDDLLSKLQLLWREQDRTPRTPQDPELTPSQAITAHMQWLTQCQATAQAAREAWTPEVLHALQAKRLKGASEKNYAKWLEGLQAWAEQSAPLKPDTLARFTLSALQDKGWPEPERFAFFAALDAHVALAAEAPDTAARITQHAAHTVGLAYQAAKTQRAAFDFSDLLQNLYRAVMAEDGRLAAAIRTQYPVALVDEFQDTDPWQYGSLHRIYDPAAVTPAHALVMIGDPKQAIYSFRGADLSTYLQARGQALAHNPDALHTLSGNRRSSAGLVRAINHVFTQIDAPFSPEHASGNAGTSDIAFVEVTPEGDVAALPLGNGRLQPGLTVWQLQGDEPVVKAGDHLHHMAAVFADQMALLLNQRVATPGDMAVLVRSQSQADAVREALRQRGVASVYLSDHASVFESPEALDLWRLLRAVASPRQTRWVRAALGSPLWALSLDEVLAITQDETQWEALLDQFHHWQHLWQQHGVLPMLHQWLHSGERAQRLVRAHNGERRLSNLLHLGELLQHAAQSLQGEHALVRHLGQQIQQPSESSDAHAMRLETDAQCVQVITYHKSKGLQYPLVFVPFAGSFSVEKTTATSTVPEGEDTDSASDTPSSTDEDMRLLYVALTRAQRALWLGVAETARDLSGDASKGTLKRSALSRLLKRRERGDLQTQLHALWATCSDIAVDPLPALQQLTYQPPVQATQHQAARTPQRQHHSLWWTASFSTLTRGLSSDSLRDEAVADAITDAETLDTEFDLPSLPTTAVSASGASDDAPGHMLANRWQSFPAGASYGTLLHDLLEWQSLHQWPAARDEAPTWAHAEWHSLLQRKARWLQLDDAAQALLPPWITALLNTPLPLQNLGADLVLSQLPREALWAEMEFSFEAHGVSAATLDQLIGQHLLPDVPRPALQARMLQGMLTGFMDLVVAHDGRYWVVDYKSNKLADYGSASLQDAVLHKRYDVQYVLYTLALHRLLKVRLADYDYDLHMGGAVYLFLRGIEQPGAGVHVQRPPRALVEALDAAFAGGTA
jgi:exodeoxyribonuclease V beta subunit